MGGCRSSDEACCAGRASRTANTGGIITAGTAARADWLEGPEAHGAILAHPDGGQRVQSWPDATGNEP